MVWTLDIQPRAAKAIRRLHPQMQRRILVALDEFRLDPFASTQVKAMKGSDTLRLRVGEWRVIYRLERDRVVIVVIDVGPRGGVY